MSGTWYKTEKGKAYFKAYYSKNKESLRTLRQEWWKNRGREISTTPKRRYSVYKKAAKNRGYLFEITLEEFTGITSLPCFYCGTNSSIGVDRVNNDLGYLLKNCVPCCTTCNRMKSTASSEDFIQRCVDIVENIKN